MSVHKVAQTLFLNVWNPLFSTWIVDFPAEPSWAVSNLWTLLALKQWKEPQGQFRESIVFKASHPSLRLLLAQISHGWLCQKGLFWHKELQIFFHLFVLHLRILRPFKTLLFSHKASLWYSNSLLVDQWKHKTRWRYFYLSFCFLAVKMLPLQFK